MPQSVVERWHVPAGRAGSPRRRQAAVSRPRAGRSQAAEQQAEGLQEELEGSRQAGSGSPPAAAAEHTAQRAAARPAQLQTALRQPRSPQQLGAASAFLASVGACCYATLSAQPELPPLPAALAPAAAVVVGVPLLALLAAKALLGEELHLEFHRGRLYLTAGVPSWGPAVQPGAVVVRPTGDVRGNGAFAAALIPKGTYLGDYTGELLGQQAFYERYPDGVGDFAAAIDSEWAIDAVAAVGNTAAFHPVHMNHSRVRPNVARYYARRERRISFFTTHDVQPGEELLYDYGRGYWRGREHLELP